VIGTMLMLSVPLRRLARGRDIRIGDTGLGLGAVGWGIVVGGTTGAGVILLSLLMATGLEGAAVIATDAAVALGMGIIKITVFGAAGALTRTGIVIALLIGLVSFPCTFLAKLIVERLPVHVHTAILDAVVIIGGGMMIFGALR